ncbi:amino acid transporter [Eremomyces bilateralis CBS 781.70]|uniref:Amino acid transporter n=1 Tax=Eremomyces bilateralis CBS 781.70 TaxID=1392243 RepID=A0A6G1GFW3_9PEZI|nr:amino acid transporter [Eremomyces bilateralis CBS 781.70]KAF1816943.1 amino acid transporter [Eremomyces bilateralis CBS 781.70]
MASTGIDYGQPQTGVGQPVYGDEKQQAYSSEKVAAGAGQPVYTEKTPAGYDDGEDEVNISVRRGSKIAGDNTHRKLKPRHIQLIGIGGTIGTALYVQIGQGLLNGGPASLFIAFTVWCTFILAVTLCMAEMVTYLPISSPFIRFAGRYVDEAFGFAAGWNFFVFEAALVPFEIVACNVIIKFWDVDDVVPAGAIIAAVLVLYGLINVLAVKWYGETEFWAAIGKVLLIIGLIIFTFIVMLGGNPKRDRFGFRYWRDPGPFAELYKEGNLGRWLGLLQCVIQASFTIAGPDYVSMAAGETENPRVVMPKAYNAVFYRLTAFFVLGSLCVGINVPYNDPELTAAFKNSEPGAAASPYVVSMNRLGIPFLPHIVNAMVLGAAFSAGNSYVYCASRSLYGLALEGKAPRFLTKCTRAGVPIYTVIVVLIISLLSFLQLSKNSAVVLSWFVSLVTASQLLNFAACCWTFLAFYRACKAQGLDRNSLPYKGFLQPYAAYYGLTGTLVMAFVGGYTVFLPGKWDIPTFLFSYTMIGVFPVLFIGWKLIKKTKWRKPDEVDLYEDLDEIEEYHRNFVPIPPKNALQKYANKIFE